MQTPSLFVAFPALDSHGTVHEVALAPIDFALHAFDRRGLWNNQPNSI
jgi:hypothetical protein